MRLRGGHSRGSENEFDGPAVSVHYGHIGTSTRVGVGRARQRFGGTARCAGGLLESKPVARTGGSRGA